MKKLKSFLSFLLAITIICSMTLTPVSAYTATDDAQVLEQTIVDGTIIHEIFQINDSTIYSFDITDNYTVSIGTNGTVADYSIRYFSEPNTVYYGTFINSASMYSAVGEINMINTIKNNLLSGTLPCEVSSILFVSDAFRSSTNDDALIKNELYSIGEPHEYNKALRKLHTASGITSKVYETLTYQKTDKFSLPAIAGTALSVVLTKISLPASIILAAATWVSTGAGVYSLLSDTEFRRYNVFGYYQKDIYAQNEFQFFDLKTRKFQAVVGDTAAVSYQSESKSSTFDDNFALCIKGIEEYQRKH